MASADGLRSAWKRAKTGAQEEGVSGGEDGERGERRPGREYRKKMGVVSCVQYRVGGFFFFFRPRWWSTAIKDWKTLWTTGMGIFSQKIPVRLEVCRRLSRAYQTLGNRVSQRRAIGFASLNGPRRTTPAVCCDRWRALTIRGLQQRHFPKHLHRCPMANRKCQAFRVIMIFPNCGHHISQLFEVSHHPQKSLARVQKDLPTPVAHCA